MNLATRSKGEENMMLLTLLALLSTLFYLRWKSLLVLKRLFLKMNTNWFILLLHSEVLGGIVGYQVWHVNRLSCVRGFDPHK